MLGTAIFVPPANEQNKGAVPTIVTMQRGIGPDDHMHLAEHLPVAVRFVAGNYRYRYRAHRGAEPSSADIRQCIRVITEAALAQEGK